jgi:tetratricopeptide (TPR) repeat protein
MGFEHTSVYRSRFAGLLLLSLAVLAGACTTATRAPGTAEAPTRSPAEAVRLDPNSPSAHVDLGNALVDQGELEQAVTAYHEAVRLEPTNASLWLRIGQLYEQMDRGDDALKSLEAGLKVDPANPGILNQLGWLHATAEDPAIRDPAKALAYAQRAVEASEGMDANMLDTLAEAYFANREFDEAIKAEEKALEIAPGLEAYEKQLQKFREAKATEGGQ